MSCQNCNKKHHTSICEVEQKPEGMLVAHQSGESEVVYPVVMMEVDGIKTRGLLDTGAESPYASAKLITALQKKPAQIKTKQN